MKIEIHRSIGFGKSFLTKEKRCVKFKLITNKRSETLLIKHLAINDKKLEINELFMKLKLKKTLYKKIFIYV